MSQGQFDKGRGTPLNRLIDDMTTVMLAEFDAETRFRLRAARSPRQGARGKGQGARGKGQGARGKGQGARGKVALGLQLLDKAMAS